MWLYFLLGAAIGLMIVSVFFAIHKPHQWDFAIISAVTFCMNCGSLTVYIARRKGRVESIEDMHRPLTLFPRDPA
jgi:hypothetical protein